jgi:DNA repair exonuclease SbcCD ATPase subunit
MLQLHSVRFKNFLSTGNLFTEVSLDGEAITAVCGRNGSGKSTMVDAIVFALYNKAFRKINKPQLINSINKKECLVEVELTSGKHRYVVRRGIKPNIFEIIRDGELIDQSAANVDYQDILETQILKMNHRTFCQVAVLGAANFVPFMQLAAHARREVVEDLLDIQIFSKMNSVLKERVAQNKESLLESKLTIELINESIAIHERHMQRAELEHSGRLDLLRENLSEAEEKYRECKDRVDDFEVGESFSEQIDDLTEKRNQLNFHGKRMKDKKNKLTKESQFFDEHDVCPTCHQDITIEFKKKHTCEISGKVTEIENGEQLLSAKLQRIEDEMTELREKQETYKKRLAAKQNLENEARLAFNAVQQYKKMIATEEDAAPPSVEEAETEVRALRRKLEDVTELRKKHLEKAEYLAVASSLLKDGGIKAKIIRQYIPIINKLVNKYLAAMDFFIQFEFDENFNETIRSKYREDFSYASFSEGEKARINIALLFAWRTLAKLRNSAATNLLILDEVFDGALDNVGTDELAGILENLAGECNAFIITHREGVMDKFSSTLSFETHGNFSVMIRG